MNACFQPHRWAAPLLALALSLAACGGTTAAELATIDEASDDSSGAAEESPLRDSEAPVSLETSLDDPGGGDDLPVPDAVEPAPPAMESSPAARQANQTAGIPAIDDETGRYERLPIPEEDLDDASYLAGLEAPAGDAPASESGAVITIPVTGGAGSNAGPAVSFPGQASISGPEAGASAPIGSGGPVECSAIPPKM